jgi:xylan 1,4-beta-xylosidase
MTRKTVGKDSMIRSSLGLVRHLLLVLSALTSPYLLAQEPVEIHVDAAVNEGPFKPIYSYFGYDESNYTYMKDGRQLVGELAALSFSPVYLRGHNMLNTGNGTPDLKWSSTNAYTEDANGKPIYDWTIIDRIVDTYVAAKAKPYMEIGFMPKALSDKPDPYERHQGSAPPVFDNNGGKTIGGWSQANEGEGWAHPPKDYDKWAELVRQWVLHSVARYGKAEVESWYWEVWNEPNIAWFRGTPDQYLKLYDYTSKAVKSALPTARVGGPASTDPADAKAGAFLENFLQHCATNHLPLDFISYHVKGRPTVVDDHAQMGLNRELLNVGKGMEIINKFPQYTKLPIVLSEADPDVCAACSMHDYPKNSFRNGTIYPVYTAEELAGIVKLADRNKSNIEGMITWSFEFENRPYFDGFRVLATNGIDEPVLNVFRMFGLMHGDRVRVESNGAVDFNTILQTGVRQKPDIDALATRSDSDIAVLTWNYHDDELPGPAAPVHVHLAGIPPGKRRVLLTHYRIDDEHSNAYTMWKRMGSPQNPTPEQYAKLKAGGQLELLESPRWVSTLNGSVDVTFQLPRLSLSLIRVTW